MVMVINLQCRPATLKNASEARKEISATLKVRGVSDHLSNNIQLCFSEAAANLVNHTNPKPTYINVELECQDGYWLLHLSDDGQSWNPALPNRVQTLDTFEEKEGGRGLALIQSLTDDMEYTKRTTFGANKLTLKWKIQQISTKPSVLIVEDDDSQRRLFSAYLSEHYRVFEAENGEKALEFLLHNTVDLVISDIRMPGMDGLSLKKALHNETNTLLTPFIFLTYSDNPETRSNALGLGIDDYIVKPVSKSALTQSVQRVLNRSDQIYRQLTDKINQRITSALTPSLPSTSHGWNMSIASRNTGIGGGDLVLHRDTPDFLMVNLADVMGHDVAAKFFSYAYGGYLRGLMYQVDAEKNPCATLLNRLSDCALEDNLLSQVILTCCSMALFDDGTIQIASAGHPAPFKVSENLVEPLNIGGILPGVLYGAEYDVLTTTLKLGERIAVYTDGLFEAAEDNEARQLLTDKVMEALSDTRELPLQEATETVMSSFEHYGERHKDDATLILLELCAREKE
ncbi:SpoIIE family protein phosphatase [Enterovibrio makurazakiensis]|uniref:SpoIIE family protein phosphatase n=1 Tax=Enterovibrio makurazakiensis TaxID=2910232 RepID=UPI003D1BA43A